MEVGAGGAVVSEDVAHYPDALAMVFHVPDDPEWLKAFGRVSIVHTHLDHILRMLIKTLANVTVDVAMHATESEGSAALRDRIKKLAKQQLGEGAALLQVQDIVERCRRVTERRNSLIHTTIASDWLDAEAMLYRAGFPAAPLPKTKDLESLEDEIGKLISEINRARLKGWLAEALAARPHK
jgi:hypothetical protein